MTTTDDRQGRPLAAQLGRRPVRGILASRSWSTPESSSISVVSFGIGECHDRASAGFRLDLARRSRDGRLLLRSDRVERRGQLLAAGVAVDRAHPLGARLDHGRHLRPGVQLRRLPRRSLHSRGFRGSSRSRPSPSGREALVANGLQMSGTLAAMAELADRRRRHSSARSWMTQLRLDSGRSSPDSLLALARDRASAPAPPSKRDTEGLV